MEEPKNDIINMVRNLLFIGVMVYVVWALLGIFDLQEAVIKTTKLVLIAAGIGGGVIVICWGVYKVYNWKKSKKMREKGLVKYEAGEEEKWVSKEKAKALKAIERIGYNIGVVERKLDEGKASLQDLEKLEKIMEEVGKAENYEKIHNLASEAENIVEGVSKRLVNRVVESIEDFKPGRKEFSREEQYQLNLHGYLKREFPSAKIEESRSSSRPDIVVGDIAIEVKGPTYSQDLATISDKVMRYMQNFKELIVVLFDVKATDERYGDWKEGMKNSFSNVKVIRRDFD